jgi:hypothetical protein
MSEAALSFPGFVLPPEVPSWGGMLSREGRQYMEMAPKLGTLAGGLPGLGGLWSQHVRRCGAGSVRSATSWWRGQLRHRKEETQTRLALQTAPPLRLARSSLPNRVAKPNPPHGLKASGRRLHNTRHLLHICFLLRWRAAAVVLHLATAVSLAGSPSVRHSPT